MRVALVLVLLAVVVGLAAAQSKGARIAAAARRIAGPTSKSRCAEYTRRAIESALGVQLRRTNSAKNYGPSLLAVGFRRVEGPAQVGDVAIIQPVPGGSTHGHMQSYGADGKWRSDFVQRDQYPGNAYRRARAPLQLYRISG